jgi:Xaa-Pro aminopeptidase
MPSANLEHALFSREEMESRYTRARERMARQHLDVLLISGEENFQYFAAAAASLALHQSLTRPSVFILPLDRAPIVITQGRNNLEAGSYVADIRDYSALLNFPHQVIIEALQDASLADKRIGVELGQEQRMGLPVGTYLDLLTALPQAEFVDAAAIFIALRMVKSSRELAYMREAAAITARARQRLFDQLEPGMTERQVARLVRQFILEEGGDDTSFVILQSGLPGAGNPFHYDRPLEKGAVVAVDTGACVGMYTIDYPRMAVLGKATEKHRRVHEATLEVKNKIAAAFKPGIRCSDLHRLGVAASAAIQARCGDLEPMPQVRIGHGQGMLLTEPPSICPEDHTVLEAGTVLSSEPGMRCGEVQFLCEDVYVLTEEGREQLTLETNELKEII